MFQALKDEIVKVLEMSSHPADRAVLADLPEGAGMDDITALLAHYEAPAIFELAQERGADVMERDGAISLPMPSPGLQRLVEAILLAAGMTSEYTQELERASKAWELTEPYLLDFNQRLIASIGALFIMHYDIGRNEGLPAEVPAAEQAGRPEILDKIEAGMTDGQERMGMGSPLMQLISERYVALQTLARRHGGALKRRRHPTKADDFDVMVIAASARILYWQAQGGDQDALRRTLFDEICLAYVLGALGAEREGDDVGKAEDPSGA